MAAFKWFSDLFVKGRVASDQLNLIGQNDAETDAFAFTPVPGLGVRLLSWIFTTSGTIYNQGNGQVKADGDLQLQGRGKTLFFGANGITVNNGTNAARAALDLTGDAVIDGNLKVTSVIPLAAQTVTISPTQAALLAAIAAATKPTIITWTGVITLTSDIELQNKSNLELNCYCRGGLTRANSPNMVIIRGGINNCAIRGIDFVNTNTSATDGSLIRFNEQGVVDGLYIESNTFLNAGTNNNAISSNSSGGANNEYITTHRNIYIRRNKFGGNVGSGTGISRMAIELVNHSADGAGPVQFCDGIYIEHNEIYKCGTGSDDGFGISLSGLFRKGRVAHNVIVDAKKYSLEGVAICDIVYEGNLVVDIDNTSNGISLSNGYKAAGAWPDGTMERVVVKDNVFDVKGRAILSYYYNNCQFTNNTGVSWLKSDFIGNENTFIKNKLTVLKDWNAMHFEQSSRNRLVANELTTTAYNNGTYTSSVIFFDTGSNNSYLRKNILTRPTGSYNVHIEQKDGVSNDTGAAFQSSTNTVNTYIDR